MNNQEETFIERGTEFPLRNGKLMIYETNCACKDIQFYFDQYVITMMLSGHKTIVSENITFEFFPGTFYIPEKEVVNTISIPNATIYNPTKCLVLEMNPSFIQSVYEDILCSDLDKPLLFQKEVAAPKTFFLSNDALLLKAFTKLYNLQLQDHSIGKPLVEELVIKEIFYRVFSTEGLHLLKMNFEKSIDRENIRKVISHIHQHIDQKLTAAQLAQLAGLGQTTFFKVFKECTGKSPIDYIMHERIRRAKILIEKNKLNLQEIAYQCGFNSYEYFCSIFKKIEKSKPSEFKRSSVLD